MPNHVHLIGEPKEMTDLAKFMHGLNRSYTAYFNKKYNKVGYLWQGRFRSKVVAKDDYLIDCLNYIELNPVRAGMVTLPQQYPFSSYRYYAQGIPDTVITPSPAYLSLSDNPEDRRKHRRLPVRVTALCRKVGSVRGHTFSGNTVDICPEGLLLETRPEFIEGSRQDFTTDTGDLFNIELDIPDADSTSRFNGKVSAYARVVRIASSQPEQKSGKKQIAFQFCTRPQFDI